MLARALEGQGRGEEESGSHRGTEGAEGCGMRDTEGRGTLTEEQRAQRERQTVKRTRQGTAVATKRSEAAVAPAVSAGSGRTQGSPLHGPALLRGRGEASLGASVVLIGAADVDVARLSACSNVHALGPKAFAELPAYAAHFSVGIIPFVVNELTRAVNPIKLREMLSAGCPVVSTALPEVERYAGKVLTEAPQQSAVHAAGQAQRTQRDTGCGQRENHYETRGRRESGESLTEAQRAQRDTRCGVERRSRGGADVGGREEKGSCVQAVSSFAGRGQASQVRIGRNADEFVNLVVEAVRHPFGPEERRTISRSMDGETWGAKVDEVLRVMGIGGA
jgi:hypothetical protein